MKSRLGPSLHLRKWNGSVWSGSIFNAPYFKFKRETIPNGSRSNKNGGGRCTQSQKSSFLRYMAREMIKQTKESSLISYPFHFGTVPFGSARLHWNRTKRFQLEPFLQRTQKVTDSGSKWNGSKGSSVNARPIRTNFGTIPFGSSVSGV